MHIKQCAQGIPGCTCSQVSPALEVLQGLEHDGGPEVRPVSGWVVLVCQIITPCALAPYKPTSHPIPGSHGCRPLPQSPA